MRFTCYFKSICVNNKFEVFLSIFRCIKNDYETSERRLLKVDLKRVITVQRVLPVENSLENKEVLHDYIQRYVKVYNTRNSSIGSDLPDSI